MAQKYRIYINEKVILLTVKTPKNETLYQKVDGEHFDLKIVYHWVDKQPGKLFYVLCDDAKAFLKKVIKNSAVIEAAGGLVTNQDGEHLFIYRNDKWDLPKGKIEKKEKTKVAAVREVEEECGIKVNTLEEKICKTYHTYIYKGEVVLKKTHWFKMGYKGKAKLVPQLEEGITDVRWFKKEDVATIVKNTFPSIIDVLEKEELITNMAKLLSE
ncbi:NUDIX domain-containing protein [Mucilaginibacter sp. JC4]|uniref:NUDIX domain-containing protein n=1 Tax=Mucilaginibacter aquariorum TaxID=2967225 RepID=A0ABT1SZ37_9SPHI|nr:NUDIX domain-containing protein [Mucilaginibacter aquariorum]MCQ6956978.1 NUDIX domain-containing protein [Mucilaginibacter aquariorum]